MNFKRIHVSTIIMECDHADSGEPDKKKMDYLTKQGYKCSVLIRNCMCTHNSFVPSVKPSLKK